MLLQGHIGYNVIKSILILIKSKIKFQALSNPKRHFIGDKEPQVTNPWHNRGHGRPQGGEKRAFSPLETGNKKQNFWKTSNQQFISISWVNSCK